MAFLNRMRDLFARAPQVRARSDEGVPQLSIDDFASLADGDAGVPQLSIDDFASLADWESHKKTHAAELEEQAALERRLMAGGEDYFEVEGYCFVCDAPSHFAVSYDFAYEVEGVLTPNWREHLRCRSCGLANRTRAALHLLATLLAPVPGTRIYITEQLSPIHDRLKKVYAEVIGSEYLRDGTPCGGRNEEGVRHEDLTRLSFDSERFDLVISFDVLEHVPGYRAGLAECARVLRPGGALLLSVPFLIDAPDHLVRAGIRDDGTVEHYLPPEYHGDPLDAEGCLAFYQFGWQLLDELRQLGFVEARGHLYWSRHFAYLGRHQLIMTARKSAAGAPG